MSSPIVESKMAESKIVDEAGGKEAEAVSTPKKPVLDAKGGEELITSVAGPGSARKGAADGGAGHSEGKQESLQESFMRFKRERAKAMRLKKEAAAALKADPKRNEKLRAKFVERIRHYIGVPYAQKYHEPGTPDYDAPLFLDCCGLIRQVMDDLQEEFGFRMGRWNQAYQFDTLPVDLAGPAEMKPGDLVFYTGDYVSAKAKKQKHDLVHVEVFIGGETGEATIGARWHKGHVQVFDSYMFEAKSYTNMKCYFKSIEPWLNGECKSHCEEHPWEFKGFSAASSDKSVFWAEDAEAASDGEDDEESESKA